MNLKPPHSFVTLGLGRTRHISNGPERFRYVLCPRLGKMKDASSKNGPICKRCLKQYRENEE